MRRHPRRHPHQTIAEAGACEVCRQDTIAWLTEYPGPCVFVLRFLEPDDGEPGFAVVAAFDRDNAVESAWATGCNPGGAVHFEHLRPGVAELAGVPLFRLLRGADADAAWAALQVGQHAAAAASRGE